MSRVPRSTRAAALGVALALAPLGAAADTLTATENARLAEGWTVEHPQRFEREGNRYAGGLTYAILDASADEVDAVLRDTSAYRQILPYTKDARSLGREGDDLVVWLRQGRSVFDASYTIRIRAGRGSRRDERVVRFWIDRSRHHGIDDASGYFQYEPVAPRADGRPRVLLTFGIWFDLGPGLVRDLFEGRIQKVVLSVPSHLRETLVVKAKTGS